MSTVSRRLGKLAFWLLWPALFIYFRLSERARILLICKGEVLVVRSNFGNGKWGLPGGGLHRHEAPLDGARRELVEETGIVLGAIQVKPLLSSIYRDVGFRFLCHYFVAELDTKPSTTCQKLEITELDWIAHQKLDKTNANPDVLTACAAWFKG